MANDEKIVNSGNGCGIAGFLMSIVAVVMSFIRVDSSFADAWQWIVWGVWCIAAVLSAIGVFKRPRVMAAIGLAICAILVCVYYFVAESAAAL